MEKVFSVPTQTNDLNGLMKELTKASFVVKNVACDLRRTYVYVAEKEEKDPTPIMERWVGLQEEAPKAGLISQAISGFKKLISREKKPSDSTSSRPRPVRKETESKGKE